MPYVTCAAAQCDYPEYCYSDHWVPQPLEGKVVTALFILRNGRPLKTLRNEMVGGSEEEPIYAFVQREDKLTGRFVVGQFEDIQVAGRQHRVRFVFDGVNFVEEVKSE